MMSGPLCSARTRVGSTASDRGSSHRGLSRRTDLGVQLLPLRLRKRHRALEGLPVQLVLDPVGLARARLAPAWRAIVRTNGYLLLILFAVENEKPAFAGLSVVELARDDLGLGGTAP